MSSGKQVAMAGGSGVKAPPPFPVPLASHNDVVKDKVLFLETLRSFHFSLGSEFVIPVVGGRPLDLHALYVEVTRRGGYHKVAREKKWNEMSLMLDLPCTATSVSDTLKMHYLNLLHCYESVYFWFQNESQTEVSTFEAEGFIDEAFDHGFLVSVKVNDKMLQGVLYKYPSLLPRSSASSTSQPPSTSAGALQLHQPAGTVVPSNAPPLYPPASAFVPSYEAPQLHQPAGGAIVPYVPPPHQPAGGAIVPYLVPQPQLPAGNAQRNARRKVARDPDRPKQRRSGYNFFFADQHAQLKGLYPNRQTELTRIISQNWNSLPPETKMVYQGYGASDKERYKKEMNDYKERKGEL